MKTAVVTFVAGLVFALGLGLSGMTQVDKIVDFLNLAGRWDPTLLFVLMGAIGVHAVAYRWVPSLQAPWSADRFRLPTRQEVDLPLVGGGVLFGAGWALAGLCPGPGLVSAASGGLNGLVFVGALVAGMGVFHALERRGTRAALAAAQVSP